MGRLQQTVRRLATSAWRLSGLMSTVCVSGGVCNQLNERLIPNSVKQLAQPA